MGLGFTFPHVWMFFERERERICGGLKGLPHPSKPLLSISFMLCLKVWRGKRVKENGHPSPCLDVFKIKG